MVGRAGWRNELPQNGAKLEKSSKINNKAVWETALSPCFFQAFPSVSRYFPVNHSESLENCIKLLKLDKYSLHQKCFLLSFGVEAVTAKSQRDDKKTKKSV